MTETSSLEWRIADWFERILDHAARRAPHRTVVEADAGPLTITHSFESGSSHATLTQALAGGVEPDEAAAVRSRLTIHSLEGPTSDLMLPAPVTEADLAGRVAPRALAGTRWRLTWDAFAGVVRCYDRVGGVGVFITSTRPEAWEYGAPFRAFLHWAAAERGSAMVHASTVVGSDGAAVIVGPGGTGKSTTALTGLNGGLATAGDDYVWIEPEGDRFRVRSVYRTVKTKAGDAPPSVPVREQLATDDGEKTIHHLDDDRRERLVRSAIVNSICLLGRADRAIPASAASLSAVLPSTVLQLPFDEGVTTGVLRSMCASTEVVDLVRDGDFEALSDRLAEMVGGPAESPTHPSVTVAVPVYDGAGFVERSIRSVLAQPGWDVHVVAVDDGSQDASLGLLRELEANDPRVTVISFEENRGVAAARNAALARRSDPLVAMIDQDDQWLPGRLDACWAALDENPELGFAIGRLEFEVDGDERPDWVRERWLDGPQTGYQFGAWLCWRVIWDQLGGVDETLRAGTDDADWFSRAHDAGIEYGIVEQVVQRRFLHGRNASQRTEQMTVELVEVLRRSLARKDAQRVAEGAATERPGPCDDGDSTTRADR